MTTDPNRGAGRTIARAGLKVWHGIGHTMDVIVTTRVKHLLVAAGILVFAFWGVLHQQATLSADNAKRDRRIAAHDSALAAERAFDAQHSQYEACLGRVATRDQVRGVLSSMVDLSDLFPGSAAAEQYTATRQALIEANYPRLDASVECGVEPVPTTSVEAP